MMKNQDGFSVIELVIILGIVGIVGFAGWYVWQGNKKTINNADTMTTSSIPSPTTHMTIDQLFVSLKQSIPKKYSSIAVTDTPNYPWGIAYTVSGYSYLVNVGGAHGFTMAAKQPAPGNGLIAMPEGVIDSVKSMLVTDGYVIKNLPTGLKIQSVAGNAENGWYYSRSDALCFLTQDNKNTIISLDCDTISDFQKVASDAQPFVPALLSVWKVPENQIIVGQADIENSPDPNYRYATITASPLNGIGAKAFFYEKVAGDTWHYYASSQEGISCSGFPNQDAAKAFASICQKTGP